MPGAERRAAEARAPRRHTSSEQRLQLARHMKQRAVEQRRFPKIPLVQQSVPFWPEAGRLFAQDIAYTVLTPHQNLVRPSLLGPSVLWYAVTAHLAARLLPENGVLSDISHYNHLASGGVG